MKKFLVLALCMLFLLPALAKADILYIGGTFTSSIYSIVDGKQRSDGGGSVDPSSLIGRPLDYLYCVDIFINVYVPNTYDNTQVSDAGQIYGHGLNNAGQVAWLLSHYGTAGQADEAYALQAAIWHVVIDGYNGHTYSLDTTRSTQNQTNLYNLYLAQLGNNTGNVSAFSWITPGKNDSNGSLVQYQGLVGKVHVPPDPPHVPEPSTLILLGAGLIGLVGYGRKRLFK